jgi:hypothetical protein
MRKIIALIFALLFSGCSSNPTESSGYSYCSQPYFSTLGYYDLSGNFNGCSINETISFPDGYVATCADNIPQNIDKKVLLLQKVTEVDEIVARITNSFGSGEETTYDITFPNYHTGGCVWKDANGEEFMTENEMGAICSLAVGSAFCN